MVNRNFKDQDFRGYKQANAPKIDKVLAQSDSKTSCGEYLRCYWHPVALTSEVSETPKEIRILGEDLVIFKTTKGNINTDFYMSPREIKFSQTHKDNFYLYRVFNITKKNNGAFYIYSGDITEEFKMTPTGYKLSKK